VGYSDMQDASGLEFDDEEDEEGTEEEVVDDCEVAGPDAGGLVLEERAPGWAFLCGLTEFAHVLLDGALADLDGELEEFAPDVFGAPETVVPGHLAYEVNGFLRDTRSSLVGLGLASPVAAEEVAVPTEESLWLYDDKGVLPELGTSGKEHESEAVSVGELWPLAVAGEHNDLVTE
jgi:hypothetical protein